MLEDIIVSHLHTTNDDHIYVWFLRYGVQHTGFFVILDYFLPFYLPNNLKNQNFEKMKKIPIDFTILHMCTINENHPFTHPNNPENWNFEKMKKNPIAIIISQKCTINDNHMMYDSWGMKHNRQNFFSFWDIFCHFTPLTTQKILKKWKKPPGDIIILHKCTKNHDHMLYYFWDMVHDRCNYYFSFWATFCLFST